LNPRRRALVAALFLLSGASGLLYEIVWSRQLARVLGGSYPAIVAVVTAFLGGLAIGAALGGRRAERLARPLRAYAILEVGIGAYCAAFPLVLALLHPVFGVCYRAFEGQPALAQASRFLVAAVALLPPAIAMGATLPILVSAVVREGSASLLGGTGLLYGINTLGAAAGAALAGLVLLPEIGFSRTLLLGAAANAAVAVGAWLLDRGVGASGPPIAKERTESGTVPESPIPERDAPVEPAIVKERTEAGTVPVFVAAFAAGAGSMLCQIAWTRAMVLAFGSTTYAFTLVASLFILGLGAGGLLAGALVRGSAPLPALAAVLLASVAATAWTTLPQFAALPISTIEMLAKGATPYTALLAWEARAAALFALVPALFMGAAFPVLVACAGRGRDGAARVVGRVYAVNTAGVIAGSLAGGMLLLPTIGTRNALLVAVLLYLGAAAALAWGARSRAAAAAATALLAGAGVAAVAFAPPWPVHLVQAGSLFYGRATAAESQREGISIESVLRIFFSDVLFHEEGRGSVSSVFRSVDGALQLRTNGKVDAGTLQDMDTQRLLGHLPMLAHRKPERVLVIGLGSGVSVAAVAAHAPAVLDVVEISPEIVKAQDHFRPWTGDLSAIPGCRVFVEDGRTHVEHAAGTYDVIVSEPTNPFIPGVSDLFTEEFFRACRRRLAPGGVLGVWLQAYGMQEEEFRRIVRTFESVFPSCSVWEMAPWQDYLLLAGDPAPDDPLSRILSRPWPGGAAGKALAEAGLPTREDALVRLWLGPAATAEFGRGGEDEALHTDDRLQLEWRAPAAAFDPSTPGIFKPDRLEALRRPGLPEAPPGVDVSRLRRLGDARNVALVGLSALKTGVDPFSGKRHLDVIAGNGALVGELAREIPVSLREAFVRLPVEKPSTIPNDLADWMLKALAIERIEEARRAGYSAAWLLQVLTSEIYQRGNRNLGDGRFAEAEKDFAVVEALDPQSPLPPYLSAMVEWRRAMQERDPRARLARTLALLDTALARSPRSEFVHVLRASVLDASGRTEEAIRALREFLEACPASVRARGRLAEILYRRGRRAEAMAAIAEILEMSPENAPFIEKINLVEGPGARAVPPPKSK
jgi:spermidine synthase